jgi:3-oxoacyl-[acyl-carrier-protein] synthase II
MDRRAHSDFSPSKVIQKIYFWVLFPTKMYIRSFCSISPAGVLTPGTPLSDLLKAEGAATPCIEPDYKELIPPMQLRRMTKPVRTGVAAAKLCMQHANIDMPASIHVGTAYGMLQDSENFLQKMIVQEEQTLTPTAFIQSTHNTVAGQIALSMGCLAHNMTFVHKAHSFESAWMDAELMPETNGDILVGAVDEYTDTSFEILKRFGVYNEENTAGEGASFFLLSRTKQENTIARMVAFDMFTANDEQEAAEKANAFFQQHQVTPSANDIVLNGWKNTTAPKSFIQNEIIDFKQYCGEYPTAPAFAVALGCLVLKEKNAERCWILNAAGKHYSIYLMKRV